MVTFGGGRPAYQQIADALRAQIVTGRLEPEGRVPSQSDLAREYKVSKEVARQALAVLRREGLTYGHPGKGTFVRPRALVTRRSATWYDRDGEAVRTAPFAATVAAAGATPTWDHATARVPADAAVAARLDVPEGELLVHTRYVYSADDMPIQLADSWEVLARIQGTPVERPEDGAAVGVVARYDLIGVRIDTVDEIVSARMPTPIE